MPPMYIAGEKPRKLRPLNRHERRAMLARARHERNLARAAKQTRRG